VKLAHHSKKRWKAVYILGEIAATLEFIICPFFWAFLFPEMLKKDITFASIVLETSLHLLCPIFIWVEIFLTSIAFPKKHILFIFGICVIYLPVNYIYSTYIMDTAVYPVMDWKDYKTVIYIAIAIVMGVVGFYCGSLQHEKKKSRPFMKPKTGNEDIITRLI